MLNYYKLTPSLPKKKEILFQLFGDQYNEILLYCVDRNNFEGQGRAKYFFFIAFRKMHNSVILYYNSLTLAPKIVLLLSVYRPSAIGAAELEAHLSSVFQLGCC